MNTFGLSSTNDSILDLGAVLKDKHGICFGSFFLSSTNGSYNLSTRNVRNTSTLYLRSLSYLNSPASNSPLISTAVGYAVAPAEAGIFDVAALAGVVVVLVVLVLVVLTFVVETFVVEIFVVVTLVVVFVVEALVVETLVVVAFVVVRSVVVWAAPSAMSVERRMIEHFMIANDNSNYGIAIVC